MLCKDVADGEIVCSLDMFYHSDDCTSANDVLRLSYHKEDRLFNAIPPASLCPCDTVEHPIG